MAKKERENYLQIPNHQHVVLILCKYSSNVKLKTKEEVEVDKIIILLPPQTLYKGFFYDPTQQISPTTFSLFALFALAKHNR